MDSVPRLSVRLYQRGVVARNVDWFGRGWRRRGATRPQPRDTECRGTGTMFARGSCGNKHRCHTQRITNLY